MRSPKRLLTKNYEPYRAHPDLTENLGATVSKVMLSLMGQIIKA